MATLFQVIPIGLRTVDVEALPSYIHRLATAHCATPGLLLRSVSLHARSRRLKSIWTRLATPLAALVRPNGVTHSLVDALAVATGMQHGAICSMTFLSLEHAIRRSHAVFHGHLRWCPACMREWIRSDQVPYIKLIWMLSDITCCLIHRCRLVDACGRCGRHLTSVRRVADLGHCPACGAPLSFARGMRQTAPSWLHPAPELEDLVADIALHQRSEFPEHGVQMAITALSDEAIAMGAWEKFASALHDVGFDRWVRSGSKLRSINKIVELSRTFHLPISDILLGTVRGTNLALDLGTSPAVPVIKGRRRKHRFRRARFEDRVREYIDARGVNTLPPPLTKVAQRFGISVGGLRYLAPTLVTEMTAARQRAVEVANRTKTRQLRLCIAVEISELSSPGEALSRKRILRKLYAKGRWSKNQIRQETARILNSRAAAEGGLPSTQVEHPGLRSQTSGGRPNGQGGRKKNSG